eukprot:1924438-Pleurochrysis_carterae.AAC.1
MNQHEPSSTITLCVRQSKGCRQQQQHAFMPEGLCRWTISDALARGPIPEFSHYSASLAFPTDLAEDGDTASSRRSLRSAFHFAEDLYAEEKQRGNRLSELKLAVLVLAWCSSFCPGEQLKQQSISLSTASGITTYPELPFAKFANCCSGSERTISTLSLSSTGSST